MHNNTWSHVESSNSLRIYIYDAKQYNQEWIAMLIGVLKPFGININSNIIVDNNNSNSSLGGIKGKKFVFIHILAVSGIDNKSMTKVMTRGKENIFLMYDTDRMQLENVSIKAIQKHLFNIEIRHLRTNVSSYQDVQNNIYSIALEALKECIYENQHILREIVQCESIARDSQNSTTLIAKAKREIKRLRSDIRLEKPLISLMQQIQNINAIKLVRCCCIINNEVRVSTHNVYCNFEEKTYLFGQYNIHISFSPSIKVVVLNTKHTFPLHPHIGDSGIICSGDQSEVMYNHVSMGRIDLIIIYVIEVLTHYNPNGEYAHQNIEHFPQVGEMI
jgi:hypothetical protein